MAWTTPGTATAGEVLTAAFWNTQVRDNMTELAPFFAAWTSYTPTLTNTTASITAAKYLKIGNVVSFYVILTCTGAQVTGLIGIGLPFAAKTANGGVFNGQFDDTGILTVPAIIVMPNTSRCDLYGSNSSGGYTFTTATSATIPFTWANTDAIRLSGIYEAA